MPQTAERITDWASHTFSMVPFRSVFDFPSEDTKIQGNTLRGGSLQMRQKRMSSHLGPHLARLPLDHHETTLLDLASLNRDGVRSAGISALEREILNGGHDCARMGAHGKREGGGGTESKMRFEKGESAREFFDGSSFTYSS